MKNIFEHKIIPTLQKIKNLKINLYPIKNDFFGDMVTVSGLMTGGDIINQLRGKNLGQAVWCSYRVLNDEGTLTIDDMTTKQISDALGVPFNIAHDSFLEIFDRDILG